MENGNRRTVRTVPHCEGSAALIIVLLLVVLIGAGAFVVDMGDLFRVRNEVQTAADAAALAGASQLNGSAEGIAAAYTEAERFVAANAHDSNPISIDERNVAYGEWHPRIDETPGYFEALEPSEDTLFRINAVKVSVFRNDEQNGPVRHILAPILGTDSSPVGADAIAVGGGTGEACAFPMVVGECSMIEADPTGMCDYCMVMSGDNNDTAGWTAFGANLGNGTIASAILDVCYESDRTTPFVDPSGECAGTCRTVSAGESLKVKNGVAMQDQKPEDFDKSYCETVKRILQRNMTESCVEDATGKETCSFLGELTPFTATVPVIAAEDLLDAECSVGFRASGSMVTGFAKIEIYGARCGNSDEPPFVVDGYEPDCGSLTANEKYIAAKLSCNLVDEGPGGGRIYGQTSLRMKLVE